jgi:hypothetical protein
MLFATRLQGSLTLATVSDVSLPLSQVRSRTRALAKSLLETIAQQENKTGEPRHLNAAVRRSSGSSYYTFSGF